MDKVSNRAVFIGNKNREGLYDCNYRNSGSHKNVFTV